MLPIWIAVFFGAVYMAYVSAEVPRKQAEEIAIKADVSATNLLAYRKAVQKYMQDHPGAVGTIADSSLGPYWLHGYIRDANWTNLVIGGALYVYSTKAVDKSTLDALWQKTSENLLLGTKDPVSGRLRSYKGFDTGIVLPAGIPNNAVVIMGL